MSVDSRITDLEKKVRVLERQLAALTADHERLVAESAAQYQTVKQTFAGIGKGL